MLNKSSFLYVLWIDIGRIVILVLASGHIALEVGDLCVTSFYPGLLHYSHRQWLMNSVCFGLIKLPFMSSRTSGFFPYACHSQPVVAETMGSFSNYYKGIPSFSHYTILATFATTELRGEPWK